MTTAELHNREWDAMWAALYAVAGSYHDGNPESGEQWQYMGTCYGACYETLGESVVHQFRHRDRPEGARRIINGAQWADKQYGRIYLALYASEEYAEAYKRGEVRDVEPHPFKVLD